MKKLLLLLAFFTSLHFSQTLPPGYFAKEREIYFSFPNPGAEKLIKIARVISLDNYSKDTVYAYANEQEFADFQKFKLNWLMLPHPGDVKDVRMSSDIQGIKEWDSYPTYEAYVAMMTQFAAQYPNLCKLIDAGNTVQGRKIYFVKISDNVLTEENEPDVMLSSTIHGDETTGYVLMLRLINYLLTNYGTDAQITDLVNGLEIYINPNANPDGTYRSGNSTVTGARRYNYNGVDVNRNFPDPADGPHPDGYAWQPETLAMVNFMPNTNFVISANFHGGVEVLNYPWDTWQRRHPDDAWMQYICRMYADTVHAHAPSTYMRYLNDGITNGYDWYRVAGGRQDYFTYFRHGREVTMEISNTKLLSASLLPAHWEYNYRSFLQYMKNAMHGLRGIVTNIYGTPIKAKITVLSHDADNSFVYSDSLLGNYHRLIAAGTYNITVSADSHITQTFNNVVITNQTATVLNAQLVPLNYIPVELTSFTAARKGNEVELRWSTASEVNNAGFEIERSEAGGAFAKTGFVPGNGTTTLRSEYSFTDKITGDKFSYRLKQTDLDGSYKYSQSVAVDESGAPAAFVLNQNYPNPFGSAIHTDNPSTVICYSSPSVAEVNISIYNSLGREVARLFGGTVGAGNHRVEWNAEGMSAGNYFCRMNARSADGGEYFSAAIKLTLIK